MERFKLFDELCVRFLRVGKHSGNPTTGPTPTELYFFTRSKFNHSFSDSSLGDAHDGGFTEAVVGYAYRPVKHDRLNALVKYTYFFNLPTADRVNSTSVQFLQKSHIASLDASYDVTAKWTLGVKYAYRLSQVSLDLEDPESVGTVPGLNDLAMEVLEVEVMAFAAADPEARATFGWEQGAGFPVEEVGAASVEAMARRLPRFALVTDGNVAEVWNGTPPDPQMLRSAMEGDLPVRCTLGNGRNRNQVLAIVGEVVSILK